MSGHHDILDHLMERRGMILIAATRPILGGCSPYFEHLHLRLFGSLESTDACKTRALRFHEGPEGTWVGVFRNSRRESFGTDFHPFKLPGARRQSDATDYQDAKRLNPLSFVLHLLCTASTKFLHHVHVQARGETFAAPCVFRRRRFYDDNSDNAITCGHRGLRCVPSFEKCSSRSQLSSRKRPDS
ncbi:hypothetical protein BC835DRAFT_767849 [Cytidiella melzeri]|nr:hypothetical protein BC835DRAFT_767849 [Cytidiella melzeri]